MAIPPCRPVDPEVPGLLRLQLQQFEAGDDAGQQAALNPVGPQRLAEAQTVVGALCLGGAEFAARLAAHGREPMTPTKGCSVVLEAFGAVVDAPPGAPDDHETRLAEWLVETFGLKEPAPTLLDTSRAEFLITAGPLEEVPEAALVAMSHAQWELSLRGFVRIQLNLQEQTPRNVYGMAAMCMHKLPQLLARALRRRLSMHRGGRPVLARRHATTPSTRMRGMNPRPCAFGHGQLK